MSATEQAQAGKELPILFSAPMVRAILSGSKSQTRRIVKPKPSAELLADYAAIRATRGAARTDAQMLSDCLPCPYGKPGDRLWVRETWREWSDAAWHYAADGTVLPKQRDRDLAAFLAQRAPFTWESYSWRPSIHMPRRASRITLEVTKVRVERLQDISTDDCWAEGIESSPDVDPAHEYRDLWESINGPGSWDANPWVWVVAFRSLQAAQQEAQQ